MRKAKQQEIRAIEKELLYDSKLSRVEEKEKKIDRKVEYRAKEMADEKIAAYASKNRRINRLAVSALSISFIHNMCITGAWISDHTSVFIGKTGVMNFLVYLWEFFKMIGTGIADFLNMIVIFLSAHMSVIMANLAVYGVLIILLVIGSILIIRKGIPKWKEKIEEIEIWYNNRGILEYKRAMALTLCMISFSWAVLLAEYMALNVILTWLILSLLTNILYHAIFFEKPVKVLEEL